MSTYRAIKRIPKTEKKLHDFWLREARILKNLSYPLIPIIYDLEEDLSYSYIIMEYLKGISLKDYRRKQKMTEQEIGEVALQVCHVLHYLHEQKPPLLYLDLKPENLIIYGKEIKFVDFGAVLPKNKWNKHSIVLGTKGYAAPELLEGKELNERSDIYSFGMLLFFLFTGEAPKRKQTIIQNIDCLDGISKEWKDIVNECLKYVPNMRFTSIISLEERILFVLGLKQKKKAIMEQIPCRLLRIVGNGKGTSHVCLMLAFLLAEQGKKVAYREIKEHGVVESLLLWMEEEKRNKSLYHNIRLFRGEEEKSRGEEFDIEIRDYGNIENDLSKELYDMKHVVFVTGARCWERKELEQILEKFQEFPLLCMNFVSGREFFKLAEYYRQYICLQVPYQPDFLKDSSGQGKKFAQRLWEEAGLCLEKKELCGKSRNRK